MSHSEEPQSNSPYLPPPRPYAPAVANRTPGFRSGFGLGTGIGLGLMLGAVVLSIVSGLFAIAVAGILVRGITPDGASTSLSPLWGAAGAKGRLRAITVSGTILTSPGEGGLLASGTYGYEIAQQLDELTADDAAGVVLLINSPGGSVTGSRAISDAVERYRTRTGLPVLVHVEGMSASGGVYSMVSATEITADHGSMIGSIGVVLGPLKEYRDVVAVGSTLTTPGVTTTGGITQRYVTAGTGKDIGNPYRPATEEEIATLQTMVDGEYNHFVQHVSKNRNIPEETIRGFGAAVYNADDAVSKGLIDRVMGREEFFRHAATTAGLDPDDTVVETVRAPSALESLLGAERAWGVSPALRADEATLVAPALCSATRPLVFAGDVRGVCG